MCKCSYAWHKAPNYNHSERNHPTQPLPIELYNTHPLIFKPQQCIYIDGSFIPSDENGIGNTTRSHVYWPANNLWIVERLLGLQKYILKAELDVILIAVQCAQHHTQDTHIFTNSLDSIYLLHNHIRHPSSQHNHPDKLLIVIVVNHITWSSHKITIQKVIGHMGK